MKKNQPIIVWQKWIDPFGHDSEESRWTDYTNEEASIPNEDNTEEPEEKTRRGNPVKVIASPMGLIPYSEHTAAGKIFNFWVGHTNFNLSERVIDEIESVDGVETLDVFTRYRFRIAIGKCFDDSEVMHSISQTVNTFLEK